MKAIFVLSLLATFFGVISIAGFIAGFLLPSPELLGGVFITAIFFSETMRIRKQEIKESKKRWREN